MYVSNDATGGGAHLPDFFVVGAAKAGTTSLHYYLAEHPGLCMPVPKEPWFFSFADAPPPYAGPDGLGRVVTELREYASLFRNSSEDVKLGDASPTYLYLHEASIANMRRIYGPERFSRLRIVILLRQPADRAWSQYWTLRRGFREPLEYREAIRPETIRQRLDAARSVFYDYLGFGMYYEQVKAYMDEIGRDKVRVLLFEDLEANAARVCTDVFSFVGVSPGYRPHVHQIHNASGKPRSEALLRFLVKPNAVKSALKSVLSRDARRWLKNAAVRRMLAKTEQPADVRADLTLYFRDDILKLQDLLDRDLGHWLAPSRRRASA